MEKYFGLLPNCKYAYGKNGGCIYDTLTGKMIAIDEESDFILRQAFRNNKVDDEIPILNDLVVNNFGEFYEKPLMHECLIDGRQTEKYQITNSTNKIERLFVQITNECNKDCAFCNKTVKVYTKTHCKKWNNVEKNISQEVWKENLKKMKYLGLREVRFIGGNPFLNISKLQNIIKCAKEVGIDNFYVYSNLEVLNDDMLNLCRENNIKIILEVLEWKDALKENIIKCIDLDVVVESSILLSKKTEDKIEKICNELKELQIKKITLEYLYCSTENSWYSSKYSFYKRKKTFGRVSEQSLLMHELCNNCLYGQIYINISGDVTPCPMMNDIKLGNIVRDDLYEILCKTEYQEIIHLTRSKLPKCKDCAYRYNCLDCRALEMSKSGNLYETDFCEFL